VDRSDVVEVLALHGLDRNAAPGDVPYAAWLELFRRSLRGRAEARPRGTRAKPPLQ